MHGFTDSVPSKPEPENDPDPNFLRLSRVPTRYIGNTGNPPAFLLYGAYGTRTRLT